MSHRPLESGHRDHGVVLLITLVLIAIAAVVLAATARRSMSAALDVATATEDLQRRWAAVSLEAALADSVGSILDRETAKGIEPIRRIDAEIEFGTARVTVAITDEQATVNVNALLAGRSRSGLVAAVRALSRPIEDVADEPLRVRLRPQTQRVSSFAQVFDRPSPQQILSVAPDVTCWGNGRLNWRRASDRALKTFAAPAVGSAAINQLIDLRKDDELTLEQAIAQLDGVPRSTRQQLPRYLTDRSACFGIWVTVHGQHRDWHSLRIVEHARPDDSQSDAPQSSGGSTSEGGASGGGGSGVRMEW